ncbi:cation diffusion facilitator family transporter [Acholeplasma sp. OttesenSCG-928-E16]|nr:cation diffusion facilitator family transporter [Acholeplasma sp. OttesenSCG-928-E16]
MKIDKAKKVNQVITFSLLMNIMLTIIKLLAGIFGNAFTLVSDGLNSLGDVFTSLLLLIVMRVANKKADKDHPYGHQKYEGIMHFVIGIVVGGTGVYIFISSITSLVDFFQNGGSTEGPELVTVFVALAAILTKLVLFIVNRRSSKKYDSVALKAASIDHITDTASTTVGLIGLIIAQFGLIYFDYIASIVIAVIIFKASFDIIKEAISFLVDQAPKDEIIEPIRDFILKIKGVLCIDDLKVRMHMTRLFVDVEIAVDENLSLKESHDIAENVHEEVEEKFDEVIHCMVHVNPYCKKDHNIKGAIHNDN